MLISNAQPQQFAANLAEDLAAQQGTAQPAIATTNSNRRNSHHHSNLRPTLLKIWLPSKRRAKERPRCSASPPTTLCRGVRGWHSTDKKYSCLKEGARMERVSWQEPSFCKVQGASALAGATADASQTALHSRPAHFAQSCLHVLAVHAPTTPDANATLCCSAYLTQRLLHALEVRLLVEVRGHQLHDHLGHQVGQRAQRETACVRQNNCIACICTQMATQPARSTNPSSLHGTESSKSVQSRPAQHMQFNQLT